MVGWRVWWDRGYGGVEGMVGWRVWWGGGYGGMLEMEGWRGWRGGGDGGDLMLATKTKPSFIPHTHGCEHGRSPSSETHKWPRLRHTKPAFEETHTAVTRLSNAEKCEMGRRQKRRREGSNTCHVKVTKPVTND